VEVVVRPALHATASDVLDADGYLLGTPANLGSMAGALKHFFDTIYYPCLTATVGRPYGCSCTATSTSTARSSASRRSSPACSGRGPRLP
jgi:multimeric flavodoxin WrbA